MSRDVRDLLSLESPILQAGMGGGLSGSKLAAAVSNAGGLGTVGFTAPEPFERAIVDARAQAGGKPVAANFLMPFLRSRHVAACIRHRVSVVTLFYGFRRGLVDTLKNAGAKVIYQVGSIAEAERVMADGADALIVQGHEAGGHLRGTERLERLLPKIRERFPATAIIAAGGISDAADVARCRALGADGVSCGTRFLMTEESRAHEAYKQRLVEANETVATRLFGLGWSAPHRVVPNAATRKWCAPSGRERAWLTTLNRVSDLITPLAPMARMESLAATQTVSIPFYSPAAVTTGMRGDLVDVTALYAGECVARIDAVCSAAAALRSLSEGS